MGYLLDQMEKLAKESNRSFGDKVALGAGTGAGMWGASSLMNAARYHAMGSSIFPQGSFGEKLSVGAAKAMEDTLDLVGRPGYAVEKAQIHGQAPFKAGMKAFGRQLKQNWKALPKKVKLLSALSLPVVAAGGYGGYKGADALLDN